MTASQDKIAKRHPRWTEQIGAAKLCGTLMGGTRAMRAAGTAYLPMKKSEQGETGQERGKEYANRLELAFLDNFFERTVNFYLGQVFQKEIAYKTAGEDAPRPAYDQGWFDAFKENVDLAGSNLTVFGKRVFEAGLVDGVTFVLTDYVRAETATDPGTGRLMFRDPEDRAWKPKTLAADERLGLRPYFIHVPAGQVLDVWTGMEGGELAVRHFRYEETVEVPRDGDGLDREEVRQIVAWWPHKWEKWQVREGRPLLAESGPNRLGRVPVACFQAGRPGPGMTARPPLDDLAELNRSYWVAMSDHEGRLMPFVRSPAFFARCLALPKDAPVELGPGRLIATDDPNASLESVGVDSGSAAGSQTDLAEKRDAMRAHGLQTTQPNVTATASDNDANTSSSSLKGMCANFKDCLENAHAHAAMYQGWEDGPAVQVNTEFKSSLDLSLLSHLMAAVNSKIITPDYYGSQLLSMMPYSDEWDVDNVLNPDFGKEDDFDGPDLGRLGSLLTKKPSDEGKPTEKTPAGE
jgi:hypothetical protein